MSFWRRVCLSRITAIRDVDHDDGICTDRKTDCDGTEIDDIVPSLVIVDHK